MKRLKVLISSILIGGILIGCGNNSIDNENKSREILNVSYDPTREFYSEFNESFKNYWKNKTNEDIVINQSHGGSGKQGRSVIEGLDADVVTLALGYDIDAISNADLIDSGWEDRLPNNSCPYTSTIVFLVRKGNPKNIKDWDDLIREDVSIVTPNPKTSGGARWNYLAAWAYGLEKNNNDENKAKEFVKNLYENVAVLDSGARGATTSFVERNLGDVLIAWENEAYLSLKEFGENKYEIVTPSISILAEPPVAVVDKVVDEKGTRDIAEEYLNYLYSEEAQEIVAKNFYRPTNDKVKEKYKDQFQDIKLVTLKDTFGTWEETQKKHFSDGGIFDQIYLSE